MTLTADWIWDDGEAAPRNAVVRFRRVVTLAAAPRRAALHISADARYILYVNGARLGYGPARNFAYHYEYDTYDLTSLLAVGDNVLAAEVFHWGESTFQHIAARGGLLAQLEVDGATIAHTDSTWRAARSAAHGDRTPRVACQLPFEEQFDARRDDRAWLSAAFDDSPWPPATVIGPIGVAPWGALAPRTIPFLTDEPVPAVRAQTLGRYRRPEVVAAVHARPYLTPGDVTANRHDIDAVFATLLHVPHAGDVTIKLCTGYGPSPKVSIDGRRLDLAPAWVDVGATVALAAGDHVLLADWQTRTHDLDFTVTASGVAGMSVRSPLAEAPVWVVAPAPGAARAAALQATTPEAVLGCGAVWQPVAPADTPVADVHMDLTASTLLEADVRATGLPIRCAQTAPGEARQVELDFGRLVVGWIELDVEAPAGAVLDVLGYEGVQEGRPQLAAMMNNSFRYVTRAGRQIFVSTQRRGLRYLRVAVHGADGDVVLHDVRVRLSTYPWATHGDFRCSDPRLNQIWDQCAYTLRLCSEDTFTDCPTYEQTLWTGDACHADILTHLLVHGDARLPRRCLLLIADSLHRSPIAGSLVPADWDSDPIPNWAWFWALGCDAYFQLTGDADFAVAVYPALARQATHIAASRNADGLATVAVPGGWHFLDWTALPDGPEDLMNHETALAAAALKATARIADVVGQGADAARWRRVATGLGDAVVRVGWDARRQALTDSSPGGAPGATISQPTNIVALLGGVFDAPRAASLLPRLLRRDPEWIPTGSPWMHAIACQLTAEQGAIQPVLDSIRDRWGDMLDKGATTAWETFAPDDPAARWTRSWCHAWSALPAYLFAAYVVGVRPLTPGYARALIAPQLGDLAWASAQVPTPHGVITVRVERDGSQTRVAFALPAGVTAEVRLSGRTTTLPPGTQTTLTF